MTTLQILAAQEALKKMFEGGHFSICTIDAILKVTRGVPNGDDYHTLRLLHCINFRDLAPDLLSELPSLIQRVLNAPSIMFNNALPLSVERIPMMEIAHGKSRR